MYVPFRVTVKVVRFGFGGRLFNCEPETL